MAGSVVEGGNDDRGGDSMPASRSKKAKKRSANGNINADDEGLKRDAERADLEAEDGKRRRKKKRIREDEELEGEKSEESMEDEASKLQMDSANGKEPKGESLDDLEVSIQETVNKLLKSDNEALKSLFNDESTKNTNSEGSKTKAPVLPWMRFPVDLQSTDPWPIQSVPFLDKRLRKSLKRLGYTNLFPVQVAVWRELIGPGSMARDLCICSPTGSGKTLAYALPIVQDLCQRKQRELAALVVLPTRDLATQVKSVFDAIAPDVGLSVGLAIGQTSLQLESSKLVSMNEGNKYLPWKGDEEGVKSLVDILVATPGRLMDHMQKTQGFTLRHLKYLVVDETDRLLRQSYQEWLPSVLAVCEYAQFDSYSSNHSIQVPPNFPSLDNNWKQDHFNLGTFSKKDRIVKIALSATLTRDPSKISKLCLFHPLYISSDSQEHRYQLPKELKEYKLVCPQTEKPLYLLCLIKHLLRNEKEKIIVFSSSVESTHRLFLLLKCMNADFDFDEYSSHNHQNRRTMAMENFRTGKVQVLICSDAATRGVDIENVSSVISYDCPAYVKTLIHRAGRTARAGNKGKYFTILRKEEVHHFKEMLRKLDNNYCQDFKISSIENLIESLKPNYINGLDKLKEMVEEENKRKRGKK